MPSTSLFLFLFKIPATISIGPRFESEQVVIIPGIPNEQLEWDHEWYGAGRGALRKLTHVPTGHSVARACIPGTPQFEWPIEKVYEEIRLELERVLKANGLLTEKD